ncbi:MAG: hypothetical protein ABIO70_28080 [Pseudomonadota bacterium]
MLTKLLESKPVVEFGELQVALADASRSTTFRYLEQVPYRSSYNHNGRFYMLNDPDRYDRWGLCSVGDVHFSVDGTLKATVVRLVRESEAGCTQKELQDLVRIRVQLFLLAAVREGSIDRERLERFYLYLHTDPEVRQEQVRRRQVQIEAAADADAIITDEVVIRVLLVLIHHPGSQPADVVRHLRGRSPPITRTEVDAVFASYGLGEKGGPRIY